jgi:hypothetical protein
VENVEAKQGHIEREHVRIPREVRLQTGSTRDFNTLSNHAASN